jgi:hypothetical protein
MRTALATRLSYGWVMNSQYAPWFRGGQRKAAPMRAEALAGDEVWAEPLQLNRSLGGDATSGHVMTRRTLSRIAENYEQLAEQAEARMKSRTPLAERRNAGRDVRA